MTDVLRTLPPLEWRGIQVPITSRTMGFTHDDVQHKFLYRDNMLIESTGKRNLTFHYTIPMRQDIAKGPYENLFTDVLPRFLIACSDRTPAELNDPVFGIFRAKPTSFEDATDVNKRDGDDITVEFIHAPDPAEDDLLPTEVTAPSSLSSDGGALDAALLVTASDFQPAPAPGEAVAIGRALQQPPPEPIGNLFESIAGFGRQLERFGNRISAQIDRASFQLEGIEEAYTALEKPQDWPIIRSTRRLRGNLATVKDRLANPARTVARFTTNGAIGIGALSANLGIPIGDLLRLNPKLAKTPLVPAGTVILFTTTSAAA